MSIYDKLPDTLSIEDELWWCRAHARNITHFEGLEPQRCLYGGKEKCEPVPAAVVIEVERE